MNYRQTVDHVKQRQRLKHRQMQRPDDDWYPEAFFLRDDRLHHQPIPMPWFENRASKEALVREVFVPLIRAGHIRVFVFSVVMYMLSSEHPMGKVIFEREDAGEDSPARGLPRFQDVEGSVEQLWVHAFDAERHEGWVAQIKRPKRGRPQLAPFELIAGPDQMWGDMIDPIKEALR
jgi:hypothetical protein